jgi:hypothetical protein
VHFTVCVPSRAPEVVEADDHCVEGAHHVLRRDAVVLGRARRVVVLRVPVADGVEVRPAAP